MLKWIIRNSSRWKSSDLGQPNHSWKKKKSKNFDAGKKSGE